jgi:hypothetical protein
MGAVTVIVPVGTIQVGCRVALAVGVAGAPGAALIVTLVPEEVHRSEFIAVTVYGPDAKSLNVIPDW